MILSKENIFGQIYLITNKVNGKIYIGQTIGKVNERFSDHCSSARTQPKKHNTVFHSAIRKYGQQSFNYQSICFCFSRESLNEAEISLIKTYDSINKKIGYNICEGGQYNIDIIWSDKAKEGARQRQLGKKHSEETKAKMSASRKGHLVSEETRRKISIIHKGRKGHGKGKPWLGKKMPFCLIYKRGAFNKGKDHASSIKIVQLDLNKNFIQQFDSFSIATEKLKIHNISRAVKAGFTRKPGGFHFMTLQQYNKYVDNFNK